MNKILKLNKYIYITSNNVLKIIKKKFKINKIGHCGTLDPAASGLLIIYLENKTKYINKINKYKKKYITTILIGMKSLSNDLDNKMTFFEKNKNKIKITILKKYLLDIKNKKNQIPSIFSSIKHNKINLYKYSRLGIYLSIKKRSINIDKLSLIKLEKDIIILSIICSTGTYIRSIINDLEKKIKKPLCSLDIKRIYIKNYTLLKSINLNNLLKIKKIIK